MGLINLDKRTKQGRENRETLMILKVVYWIVSKILKVFYWIVVGPFILFWRLMKLAWNKRLLVGHICTLGMFIWVPYFIH